MVLATLPLTMVMGITPDPGTPATQTVKTSFGFTEGFTAVGEIVGQLSAAHFAAQNAKFSAMLLRQQADAALQTGLSKAISEIAEGRKIVAKQRAQIAGRGLDVGVGTSLELQEETEFIAAENARRQIQAATLQAYGIQMSADQQDLQADLAQTAGVAGAANTVLTSFGKFKARAARRDTVLNRPV